MPDVPSTLRLPLLPSRHSQAAELMQQWATIDIADALELLSPDFKNEEVGKQP